MHLIQLDIDKALKNMIKEVEVVVSLLCESKYSLNRAGAAKESSQGKASQSFENSKGRQNHLQSVRRSDRPLFSHTTIWDENSVSSQNF